MLKPNIKLTYTEIQTGNFCYGPEAFFFSLRSGGPGKISVYQFYQYGEFKIVQVQISRGGGIGVLL